MHSFKWTVHSMEELTSIIFRSKKPVGECQSLNMLIAGTA